MLLASLTVGCTKDDANDNGNAQANTKRISIFAEGFNNNSKVLINPNNLAADAQWVAGEKITLGADEYVIKANTNGTDFYIETANNFTSPFIAFYGGVGKQNNDVSVYQGDNKVLLRELAITFTEGKESIAFPMVAAGSNKELVFKHLTAGLKMKLTANTAVQLYRLKIIAQSNSEAQDIKYTDANLTGDAYACWVVQGPQVPGGAVGSNLLDVNAKYASEMNFVFPDAPTVNSTGLTFCVPLCISRVDKLVIVGYSASGAELFSVTTDGSGFPGVANVERNHIYNVPAISIN